MSSDLLAYIGTIYVRQPIMFEMSVVLVSINPR